MAYTPTNWQTGDVVTADKLNHIENGIPKLVTYSYPYGEDSNYLAGEHRNFGSISLEHDGTSGFERDKIRSVFATSGSSDLIAFVTSLAPPTGEIVYAVNIAVKNLNENSSTTPSLQPMLYVTVEE
jgi:hypothetical protein